MLTEYDTITPYRWSSFVSDSSAAYQALQEILPVLKRLAQFGSQPHTPEEENEMRAELLDLIEKLPIYENVKPESGMVQIFLCVFQRSV